MVSVMISAKMLAKVSAMVSALLSVKVSAMVSEKILGASNGIGVRYRASMMVSCRRQYRR